MPVEEVVLVEGAGVVEDVVVDWSFDPEAYVKGDTHPPLTVVSLREFAPTWNVDQANADIRANLLARKKTR